MTYLKINPNAFMVRKVECRFLGAFKKNRPTNLACTCHTSLSPHEQNENQNHLSRLHGDQTNRYKKHQPKI